MEILIFEIEGARFGVELDDLDEVLAMAAIRTLPGAPPFVAGMLMLRGALLPVVDLTQRLGYHRPPPPQAMARDGSPFTPYRHDTRLLVTRTVDGHPFAAILDGWQSIQDHPRENIHDNIVRENHLPAYIHGVHLEPDETVQMIRLRHALSAAERAMLMPLKPDGPAP